MLIMLLVQIQIYIISWINVVGNPYSIITYDNSTNNNHLIHNLNNINNLSIKITDQDGDLINFSGSHWSLTLTLTIKKIEKIKYKDIIYI